MNWKPMTPRVIVTMAAVFVLVVAWWGWRPFGAADTFGTYDDKYAPEHGLLPLETVTGQDDRSAESGLRLRGRAGREHAEVDLTPEEMLDRLRRAHEERDAPAVEEGLHELAALGEDALPLIRALIQEGTPGSITLATNLLMAIDTPLGIREAARAASAIENDNVREVLLTPIRELRDPAFAGELVALVRDGELTLDVRGSATRSLERVADGKAVRTMVNALVEEDGTEAGVLLGTTLAALARPEVSSALRETVRNPSVENEPALGFAAVALARIGNRDSYEGLREGLASASSQAAQRLLVRAASQLDLSRTGEPVHAWLEAPEATVRLGAVAALATSGETSDLPPLQEALRLEVDPTVRDGLELAISAIEDRAAGRGTLDAN